MAMEDFDELDYQPPKPPGLVERGLRRIFVHDIKLKFLALGITFVLWFAVTGQKRPITKRLLGVQLSFVHSESMSISNDPPSRVDITVTGSKDEIDQLNPNNLLATVVVGDSGAGNRVVRLSRDQVTIDQMPANVRVESFQPSIVSVRLEPRLDRQVEVTAKIEGRVPDGYEVRAVTISPARVRVRGPVSILNAFQQVSTESISVEGKTTSFDMDQIAVDTPNDKLDIVDLVVHVHVEIVARSSNVNAVPPK